MDCMDLDVHCSQKGRLIKSLTHSLRVDPGNRNRPAKPSLKLLDCGRKIENDGHIDTYYR